MVRMYPFAMPRAKQSRRVQSRRKPKSTRSAILNATDNTAYQGNSVRVFKRINPGTYVIPKQRLVPPAIVVQFVYMDLRIDNNAGSTYTSFRLRMNSAFDPDPALGSGSLPGFTEWSAIYRNYRVLKYEIECEASNNETFPITAIICPSQADLGLNYTLTASLAANPGAVSKQISPKGGIDKALLRAEVDLGKYYGNEYQWMGNDSFAAAINANPSTLFYMNIGCVAAGNLVSGFTTRTLHRFTVAMYGVGVYNS